MNQEMQAADYQARIGDLVRNLQPFIDGTYTEAQSDRRFERINPADGEVSEPIPVCSSQDVDRAVKAARAAFDGSWRDTPPIVRKHQLGRLSELLMRDRETLALADCVEVGKPISAALMEIEIAAGFFAYYAETIDKYYGRVPATPVDTLEIHRRHPYGVVAAIVPWNFPTINLALKLAPALAAGNAVLLKPSEYSVRAALHVAELALEAGLPPGVLNVLLGTGETAAALVTHTGVDMVTFTGSTAAGRAVMSAACREAVKPVMLECGGNNAQIVFADMLGADPAILADALVQAAMQNQGQVCMARSRLLVERSVHEELREAVTEACRLLIPGHPLQPGTRFGPVANSAQYQRVNEWIERADTERTPMLLDGRRGQLPAAGFYLGPSVFDDVSAAHPMFAEEVFGPILRLTPFDSEEQACTLANNTAFGLAATVWTRDLARAHRLAGQLDVGWVAVNSAVRESPGAAFAHAHEPWNQSGFGVEGGIEALNSYTRLKATTITF